MAEFFSLMNETLVNSEDNLRLTENGGYGFSSTGSKLVDMNFKASSYRNLSEAEIQDDFAEVCAENLLDAIVWAFFSRDARGGMGERRLFRTCLQFLADNYPVQTASVLHLVPEYGRWDDLFVLCGTKLESEAAEIIRQQLTVDLTHADHGQPVSLVAKWLPSINSHHENTRKKAFRMAKMLGYDRFQYQRIVSGLRKRIRTVESQMSANKWDEIDYEAVPSKANLIYKGAFLRHDEERRRKFLGELTSGEKKINSKTLFPYEIVRNYRNAWGGSVVDDATLEGLWKALPDYVNGQGNTIVVADGSGSMMSSVGNSTVTCLDVAQSLAIYFAERLGEPFHNKYITFSSNPQLVNLGDGSLNSKLKIARRHSECSNTDIAKVFDLILRTAVQNHLRQDEIPQRILICSDMEFDVVTTEWTWRPGFGSVRNTTFDKTVFGKIKARFEEKGYKLPRLIFWNICSRTNAIPVKENDLGVALVSGFSPSIAKMVFSNKLNPAEILSEQLHDERYLPIWNELLPS